MLRPVGEHDGRVMSGGRRIYPGEAMIHEPDPEPLRVETKVFDGTMRTPPKTPRRYDDIDPTDPRGWAR